MSALTRVARLLAQQFGTTTTEEHRNLDALRANPDGLAAARLREEIGVAFTARREA